MGNKMSARDFNVIVRYAIEYQMSLEALLTEIKHAQWLGITRSFMLMIATNTLVIECLCSKEQLMKNVDD